MKKGMELAGSRSPAVGVGGMVLKFDEIRERMKGMSVAERKRAIAMLACHFSGKQLAEALGIHRCTVTRCVREHRDIIDAAALARNSMISDMTEHRVIELLQGMDIGKIEDYKKPQAVKYLMDSMAIAKDHSKPKEESESRETVSELIFRVRQKMGTRQEKAIDVGDAVVEDVGDKNEPSSSP